MSEEPTPPPQISDEEIKRPEFSWRPIEQLVPYDNNPREHNEEDIRLLMHSLAHYGWRNPVQIAKGTNLIVAGHGRVEAARRLGLKNIPCMESADTDENHRGYRIMDNKSAEMSSWQDKMLNVELVELDSMGFNVGLTGFSDDELRQRIEGYGTGANGLTDEDEVPPAPETAVTNLGDIYLLGKHRLICGDSSDSEIVSRLMDGNKAALVVTDPPYGIDYGEKNRFLNSFQKAGRNLRDIANDALSKDELFTLLKNAFTIAHEIGEDTCSYYVTAPQGGELGLMMMMMASNLPVRHVLIWNKNSQNFSMGRLDYEYKHEPILYTWKKTHEFYGHGQFKNSVWDIDKERKCAEHPTMKPVVLIENCILNSSKEEAIVYDPFMGSGTTMIAAEKNGRRAFGIELDPIYCDVIVKRWEAFTGQKAERVAE